MKVWFRAGGGGGAVCFDARRRADLVMARGRRLRLVVRSAACRWCCRGCVNPDLRIEDKSATGVIVRPQVRDLKIEAVSGTIEEIGIAGGAEKNRWAKVASAR